MSIYIPTALKQRIKAQAKRLNLTFNSTLRIILESEIERCKIELTPEDYEEIANEIRKNKQRRIANRIKKAARTKS